MEHQNAVINLYQKSKIDSYQVDVMLLTARILGVEAKKSVVILNREDAEELDVKALDRVELVLGKRKTIALVNITDRFVPQGGIGLYDSVQHELSAREGKKIRVEPAESPESIAFIKRKLDGNALKPFHIRRIVRDVVEKNLSDIEIATFVAALYNHGMNTSETAEMTKAIAETGKTISFGKRAIYDKHSIGGIAGDETSLLVVPIVAAAGLTIPKTSSRAITAPAGTADRMECLAPVDLDLHDIKRVVRKTNGCLVWGGALELAPADNDFIEIEHPLSIDPLLLPSVMSKKKAMGAKYVVIDIPTGREAKIKTIAGAEDLAKRFIELGKKIRIKVECASTLGEQPIGYNIGPALEAREALQTLSLGRGPSDLTDKAVHLASVLFDFAGFRNSKKKAREIFSSRKAEKKLREIIGAQGGNPKIRPEDIPVGCFMAEVKSSCPGIVLRISNRLMMRMARDAGAPKDKGAGILMHKKLGDRVKKGETLFEVYADKRYKLNSALKSMRVPAFTVGKESEIVLAEIPEEEESKKYFILER